MSLLHQFRRCANTAVFVLLLFGMQAANAQNSGRVFRALATCEQDKGIASVTYMGNPKKGFTTLTSTGPFAYAGFEIEGAKGISLASPPTIFMQWNPPAANKGTFILRVKTEGGTIQSFTLGPTTNTDLPNIPSTGTYDGHLTVDIQRSDFFKTGSKLNSADTIKKASFLFSSSKLKDRSSLQIDAFNWNFRPVPIILEEPGHCDALF